MQEIEMPNGEILEFPDGMGDDQIKAALGSYKPEPMSMGSMLSQAASNAIPSAKQAASDLVQPLLHPIETAKSVGNLMLGGAQKLIPGEQSSEKYADAFGQFFKDRYGGVENIKQTFAKDPVGLLADTSMFLTGGGSAAARAPGVIGKVGRAAKVVGEAYDPIRTVGKGVAAVASPILGVTTGAGADAVRGAFNAGADGNKAFLENMRGGSSVAGDVVSDAERGVAKMRDAAQKVYLSDKRNWAAANKQIDWTPINKALDDIGDVRSFRGVSGTAKMQSLDNKASAARLKVLKIVNDWQKLDPAEYHTVLGLDALKQKIGAELKNIPYTEPSARKVYGEVYNAIKKEIIRQEPGYGAAMNRYEQAADQIEEITKTLSLTPNASVDTKLRKLQSIMRNNANTNYGRRKELGKALEAAGAKDLSAKLAGQSLNSFMPRGLAGGVGAANVLGNFSLGGLGAFLDPTVIGSLAVQSPRIVGESAYWASRLGYPTAQSLYQAGREPYSPR